jgi:transcriptional regulator with XRE-family HTH domain
METQIKREEVGERIKTLIYELRMNNNSFSAAIGVTPTAIIKTVNKLSKPRFEMIEKILEAFPHVNRDWLVSGVGEIFNNSGPASPSNGVGSKYLEKYLQKLEEGFKAEYNKILEEKTLLINSQQRVIDALIGQLGSLGKLNLSEEILPVQTQCFASPAKIITMPTYKNVA